MKCAFITFGSHEIGMGHIFRCLTVCREILSRVPASDVTFFVPPESVTLEVLGQNPNISVISKPKPQEGFWDVIIVDRLNVDLAEMTELESKCRVLVAIDNAGKGGERADIRVASLYFPPEESTAELEVFFGFDYLLIDNAFRKHSICLRKDIKDLFLSQGGADSHRLLPLMVSAILQDKQFRDLHIHVHLGPANLDREFFNKLQNDNPERITICEKIQNIGEYVSRMDVGICSGGMLACELACVGLPLILITAEAKELEPMNRLEKAGACLNNGYYAQNSAMNKSLLDSLREMRSLDLRTRISRNAQSAVDGRGVERFIEIILNKLNQ